MNPRALLRRLWPVAVTMSLSVLAPTAGAQSEPSIDARIAAGSSSEWLTFAGRYEGWRYSELTEIDRSNVGELTAAWLFQTGVPGQFAVSPVVYEGVVYVTAAYNNLFALDARTGDPLWHYAHEMPDDLRICCGPVNRGVAVAGDRVLMATLDARLVALHRTSGKVIWNVPIEDYKLGYSSTSAPLVLKGMALVGISGGEYGARGFVDAFALEDGTRRWRAYTVPGAGEPGVETWAGDSWKTGGGPTWATGAYDAKNDLVYWPTGNPSPDWNGDARLGDNLFTNSVIALDPDTGERRWHFQFTPHDVWDFDATNGVAVVDAEHDGQSVRAVLQPNRNGYLYLLDAATGAFLRGTQYVDRLNWSKGLDPSGRPVVDENYLPVKGGNPRYICPGAGGGHNGSTTYAYSAATGMVYVPSIESCGKMEKGPAIYVEGMPFWGGDPGVMESSEGKAYGHLSAIDVDSGAVRWRYQDPYPLVGGVLATAGGLVFTGNQKGYALAFDAGTGERLWKFQTGSTVRGQPISYELDGHQYIAVPSGGGGLLVELVGQPPIRTLGSTLAVFALPRR